MPDTQRPRVPIKPGFFTVPDDPAQAPKLLGTRCEDLRRVLLPAPRGVREVPVGEDRRRSSSTRAARSTATPSCTCRCSARPTWSTSTATASARSTCPRARACRRRWPASRPSSRSGRRCDAELDVLREDGGTRHRDRALPAGRRRHGNERRRGSRRRDAPLRHVLRRQVERGDGARSPGWRRCKDAGLTFTRRQRRLRRPHLRARS